MRMTCNEWSLTRGGLWYRWSLAQIRLSSWTCSRITCITVPVYPLWRDQFIRQFLKRLKYYWLYHFNIQPNTHTCFIHISTVSMLANHSAEISMEVHTCWNNRCTPLWIFHRPVMTEPSLNFLHGVHVTDEDLCGIRLYQHRKKLFYRLWYFKSPPAC